jgi:uncharacterized sporulation protein YeaH/YhbH (DUF444 family)
MQSRFNPASCNVYLFYASDGDNAADDRELARGELEAIAKLARYSGYAEVSPAESRSTSTETFQLFDALAATGVPAGRFVIRGADDVASAVRHFFAAESQAAQIEVQGAAP